MRCLVVVPTYEEAENLLTLGADVLAADASLEMLVVDDASGDGTGELVERQRRSEPRLHLLRRPAKLGLGSAYLAGFRFGLDRGYSHVLTMDGDYSHDPRHLGGMLQAAREADLVIGSRYVPGGRIARWPLSRRLLSRCANLATRAVLRLPVRDCTSGFRCYTRDILEAVDPFGIRASGYAFLEEMVWRAHRSGFRIREVPIVFDDRRAGHSKIDRAEIGRAALHVVATALRSRKSRTKPA